MADGHFGSSVSSLDELAAVGASGAASTGAAYLFHRTQGGHNQWGQVLQLTASDGADGDEFGAALCLSEEALIIGAPKHAQNGPKSGAVYTFAQDVGGPGNWGQMAKLLASDGTQKDQFGAAVSSEGSLAIVGAPRDGNGSVYILEGLDVQQPFLYCNAKAPSVAGCSPGIQFAGLPSASAASGFTLSTGEIPGQSLGIFLYSHGGAAASPVQGVYGSLCIQTGATFRTGPLNGGGTTGNCDGSMSFDWNAFAQSVQATNPASTVIGTTVDGQFWYRDPPAAGGANLTDAIGFVVLP